MSVADGSASIPVQELCDEQVLGRPLCVRLDGALLRTDTVWESIFVLLRRRPWLVLVLPFWMLRGRARLAQLVGARITLDPAALPYRTELVEVLRQTAASGRRLVLSASADANLARAVADHVALFDEVVLCEGDAGAGAAGPERRRQSLEARFGAGGFDYVSDAAADLPLLQAVEHGYLVGASRATAGRAKASGSRVRVVSLRRSRVRAVLKVLRLHQWSKNALVVVPVLLAPRALSWLGLGRAALAALSLSLCASAGYVFNDLMDVAADRIHASKRRRPFASGDLPLQYGPPLLLLLLATSFALGFAALPLPFVAMLALYVLITLTYSFYLKSKLLVDVIVLAWLYTHRVVAGGFATEVPISAWLLAFSMFFFFSLAFAKRYTELRQAVGKHGKLHSRAYYPQDLEMVASMGPIAGYMAVLVFCLYIESAAGTVVYSRPRLLWFVSPVLLYWISRVWFLAHRGEMHDDPVKFAITDRPSWLCALLIGGVAAVARFWP